MFRLYHKRNLWLFLFFANSRWEIDFLSIFADLSLLDLPAVYKVLLRQLFILGTLMNWSSHMSPRRNSLLLSLSIIIFKIITKNSKISSKLPIQGQQPNNRLTDSSENFRADRSWPNKQFYPFVRFALNAKVFEL